MRPYWRFWLGVTRGPAIDVERHADRISIEHTSEAMVQRALGNTLVAGAVHERAITQLQRLWDEGIAPTHIQPFYEEAIAAYRTLPPGRRILRAIRDEPVRVEDTHPGAIERGAIVPDELPHGYPKNSLLKHREHYDRATTSLHTRMNSRHSLETARIAFDKDEPSTQ
jgi:hypothetical protein